MFFLAPFEGPRLPWVTSKWAEYAVYSRRATIGQTTNGAVYMHKGVEPKCCDATMS